MSAFAISYGEDRISIDVPRWARRIARNCYRSERAGGARRHQAKAEAAFYLPGRGMARHAKARPA